MKILKLYAVFVVVLMTACNNYLDVKPMGKTIPKTAEEYSAILQYHLDYLDKANINNDPILGSACDVSDFELYSDNLDGNLTFYPQGKNIPVYIGSDINNFQSRYEEFFKVIGDCNMIIDNMSERDTDLGKKVLAASYTLRGICYFNLLRLYCEPYEKARENELLGLPLVEHFDLEAIPIRASFIKTVNFIENTLLVAINYNLTDTDYRVTVEVARAYLARLYFWVQRWEDAIRISTDLLQRHPLLEAESYKDMMTARYDRKGNTLLKSYIKGPDADLDYTFAMADAACRPVCEELVALFVEKERDVRYNIFFDKSRLNTKRACSCVRTDEMCLILAESHAHLGHKAEALSYLNLLRSKRIVDYQPYTEQNLPPVNPVALIRVDAQGKTLTPLMSAILNERRKEFYMEMDRWFELKRNGRPEFWVGANGFKYITERFLYTAPLPMNDLDLNDGLIQNEGYVL